MGIVNYSVTRVPILEEKFSESEGRNSSPSFLKPAVI